jgi:uncharacterized protein (DUF488 family)
MKTATDKYLFLLLKEYGFGDKIKFYSFYPYQFGPFSELFYYDLRKLDKDGFLKNERTTAGGIEEARKVEWDLTSDIDDVCGRFQTPEALIDYVYSKYPDYATRSRLIPQKEINHPPAFFTIGYESKDIDRFLDILIHQNIQLLIDVRHNPFSMQYAYIKDKLKGYLEKNRIDYIHMPELGIPSEYRKNIVNGDYSALFEKYRQEILTEDKVDKVLKAGLNKRCALMCMEKDPVCCHRSIISNDLEKKGYQVTHL